MQKHGLNRKIPVDAGRKLNAHKTLRRCPGRLMYVQFTSCVHGDKINFKIYDVTIWETNSENTNIAQYLMK